MSLCTFGVAPRDTAAHRGREATPTGAGGTRVAFLPPPPGGAGRLVDRPTAMVTAAGAARDRVAPRRSVLPCRVRRRWRSAHGGSTRYRRDAVNAVAVAVVSPVGRTDDRARRKDMAHQPAIDPATGSAATAAA